jgi:hypothetical protein
MTDINHGQRGHAKLSPSGAKRWMSCPGSIRLSEGIADKRSSFADEGTAAHELAQHCLERGFEPGRFAGYYVNIDESAPSKKFTQKSSGERSFLVDDEMVDGVGVYVDFVLGLREEYPDIEIDVERRVMISETHAIEGTADCVAYDPTTKDLVVADLKYGRGVPVEPNENPQALAYALGAAKALHNRGVGKIRVVIVQPRAYHSLGPIRSWDADIVDLLSFSADLEAAAERTSDSDAPLIPGDWCKFCKAAAICPARREQTYVDAKAEFDCDNNITLPPVNTLSRDDLAKLMIHASTIKDWCDRVIEYAHSEANHDRGPTGWKLVDKRATRKWRDSPGLVEKLTKITGGADLYSEPKLKTPAQIEPFAPGKNKKEREAAIADLVTKDSSGTTLVPMSDPRPAARAEASAEFGAN